MPTWAASNMYRPGCFRFNSTSSLVLQSTLIGDVALSDKYSLRKRTNNRKFTVRNQQRIGSNKGQMR